MKRIHWLCIGDLNEIGWAWEKQGLVGNSRGRMELFQSFLSGCEFMDLEFKGAPYTWTNNQRGPCHLGERLDKGLS